MIRITDRTLSCLDDSKSIRLDLLRFLELLIETEVDGIELSKKMYDTLSPLPSYPNYILRMDDPSNAMLYNDISSFICNNIVDDLSNILDEIVRGNCDYDFPITYNICEQYTGCSKIRIQGLDDVLLGDYKKIFEQVKTSFSGEVEFCPGNSLFTATALATEWANNNISNHIVTSFCGIGGFAPTEELIITLREKHLRKVNKDYPFFPEMTKVIEKIAGTPVKMNKPILGERIFHVESSIHVDGILKQPKCYEPYAPEVVGQTRKIFIGKQSGVATVRGKPGDLEKRGFEERIPQILNKARDASFEKTAILQTTNSFRSLADRMKARRYLVDSTLRDGGQMPGIYFTAKQKIKIASLLDQGGVHQIEAGVPATSAQEKATIEKIIRYRENAVISVWARLVESDIQHAIDIKPDMIHISIPVSYSHIYAKLRKNKAWLIKQLFGCLELAKKSGIQLSIGFEDAFRSELSFMKHIAKILLGYGITRIRLSDTVGVADPSFCRTIFDEFKTEMNGRLQLGFHSHNDLGMAVANTIVAVKNNCMYADVTIGGVGERSGNCDFVKLINASDPMFDWGITPYAAQKLQSDVLKVIGF